MNHLFKTLCAAGAAIGATLCASGHDLPINGNFYGVPSGHHIVPGWRNTSRSGGVRLYPWRKGKQILEITAHRATPRIVVSDLQPATPGMLELDADVSGTGTASLGFEAFDATRKNIVQNGKQSWPLSDVTSKIKFSFPLTDPRIAFIRVTLTAEAGSVARFGDVDADLKFMPAPVPAPVPAPAPAPVPAPVPAPAPAAVQMLMHEGYYAFESLAPVTEFQAAVPAGRDIDFKLGEHPSRGQMWTLAGAYDPRICRIEMKHKFKGYGYAKIELNAMYRGTTRLEFVNPAGKRVIVHFTSL